MRIHLFYMLCLIILVPVKSLALEPVNETLAMFYYQVPFSATKTEQKRHSFGFRMDHASYEYGEMIQYQQLMNKTAAFDLKMGRDGIQGVYVSGVDYLQLYRLNKAAEDDEAEADTESGDSESAVSKIGGDVINTVEEVLSMVPLGFMIGGVVAIGLVTGIGD